MRNNNSGGKQPHHRSTHVNACGGGLSSEISVQDEIHRPNGEYTMNTSQYDMHVECIFNFFLIHLGKSIHLFVYGIGSASCYFIDLVDFFML